MTWGHGRDAARATRPEVLRRYPTCYLGYDGCTKVSTQDDHVIPLAEGGSDDLSNRRGACKNCHDIKTQREAARGRARQRAKGKHPVERHPGLR